MQKSPHGAADMIVNSQQCRELNHPHCSNCARVPQGYYEWDIDTSPGSSYNEADRTNSLRFELRGVAYAKGAEW